MNNTEQPKWSQEPEGQIGPIEGWIFHQLGDCYNQFIQLPQEHQADVSDFIFHVHALQNIILARVGIRTLGGKRGG